MASAEREPLTGLRFRGGAPAGGQGGSWVKPPEAENFEAFVRLKEGPKLCCQYATVGSAQMVLDSLSSTNMLTLRWYSTSLVCSCIYLGNLNHTLCDLND